ncbi:response regulator receiver domain [Pectobacterium polaris]|uniref:response regulator receiver domain n=1 Tax=Pectobacterium polaris TaxID=2042057 RepID=UPI001F23952D|nr:response regulator receiver domain [Pectobacterium polaris]
MHTGPFFESSKDIVKNFLNSVVAVDDGLFLGKSRSTPRPQNLADSEGDLDGFDAPENDTGLGIVNSATHITNEEIHIIEESHQLDYQSLSLAFAEHGINCCGFIPDAERFSTIEIASTKIMESSRRADITILDWSMDHNFNSEPGTLAKASIEKIINNDKEQHGRLRLIVIYTAEPNINTIARSIKNHLHVSNGPGIKAKLKSRNITFKNPDLEFCQITVIKKEETISELKNSVIDLFTMLTIGLLSNATLSAIGELRDKTHHILHTFNKNLDPAYLSHVLGLLSSPEVREKAHEVAFDYATEIISEEFKSTLQISQKIKNHLGLEKLKQWADQTGRIEPGNMICIKIDRAEVRITPDRMKRLLGASTDSDLTTILLEQPVICSTVNKFKNSKIQINLTGANHFPHEHLSSIECKRRDVISLKLENHAPTIKQGTIVQKGNSYFICMQPLCDTVRIHEDRNFIFLKIDKVDSTGRFTHVIRDAKNGFLKFNIKPGSKDLQIFTFSPDSESNTIKAVIDRDKYKIKHKKGSKESYLIWHGELKTTVAQAIANKLAEQLSRVGLDTNEWLRLSATNQ